MPIPEDGSLRHLLYGRSRHRYRIIYVIDEGRCLRTALKISFFESNNFASLLIAALLLGLQITGLEIEFNGGHLGALVSAGLFLIVAWRIVFALKLLWPPTKIYNEQRDEIERYRSGIERIRDSCAHGLTVPGLICLRDASNSQREDEYRA